MVSSRQDCRSQPTLAGTRPAAGSLGGSIGEALTEAEIDIPLLFALQAHPDCKYRWARIVVDLGVAEGALIHGMSPSDVQDVPVEVETTVGVDLSVSTVAKV